MKQQPLARIPSTVKTALQETADRLGEVEFDAVVAGASWAFCMRGDEARRDIVADFWYGGPSELGASEADRGHNAFREKLQAWQPTVVPPSAAALLNKARAGHRGEGRGFSLTQEFVAALHWFATLPLETRLELVREYRACLETQDRLKADTTDQARFLPGPLQAEAAGFTDFS
jgi:hypothetical protein